MKIEANRTDRTRIAVSRNEDISPPQAASKLRRQVQRTRLVGVYYNRERRNLQRLFESSHLRSHTMQLKFASQQRRLKSCPLSRDVNVASRLSFCHNRRRIQSGGFRGPNQTWNIALALDLEAISAAVNRAFYARQPGLR